MNLVRFIPRRSAQSRSRPGAAAESMFSSFSRGVNRMSSQAFIGLSSQKGGGDSPGETIVSGAAGAGKSTHRVAVRLASRKEAKNRSAGTSARTLKVEVRELQEKRKCSTRHYH